MQYSPKQTNKQTNTHTLGRKLAGAQIGERPVKITWKWPWANGKVKSQKTVLLVAKATRNKVHRY